MTRWEWVAVCSNLVNVVTTWLPGADHGLDVFLEFHVNDRLLSVLTDSEHSGAPVESAEAGQGT
jgi:hypothetical protein